MTTEQVNPLATRYALTQSDEWQTDRTPPAEITPAMLDAAYAYLAAHGYAAPPVDTLRGALEAALNEQEEA